MWHCRWPCIGLSSFKNICFEVYSVFSGQWILIKSRRSERNFSLLTSPQRDFSFTDSSVLSSYTKETCSPLPRIDSESESIKDCLGSNTPVLTPSSKLSGMKLFDDSDAGLKFGRSLKWRSHSAEHSSSNKSGDVGHLGVNSPRSACRLCNREKRKSKFWSEELFENYKNNNIDTKNVIHIPTQTFYK